MTPRRFDPDHLPDQTGRTALVTGANSGLGLHTTAGLAAAGARVLMACRNADKAQAARQQVLRTSPGAQVEVVPLDLASLTSVAEAAAQVAELTDRLDVLVCNAGVMALPHRTTAEGFEMQLGTNHLGHFALTGRLLPLLRTALDARVVVVSSGAHKIGGLDLDDLMFTRRRYRKWQAYGQSKLANLLFMRGVVKRSTDGGWGVTAVAAHPGYAATELQAAGPRMSGSGLAERAMTLANRVLAQSAEQGAWPSLYAATMPALPGQFFGPDGLAEMRGRPTEVGMSSAARDDATADRLWVASEQLTGVTYP